MWTPNGSIFSPWKQDLFQTIIELFDLEVKLQFEAWMKQRDQNNGLLKYQKCLIFEPYAEKKRNVKVQFIIES